MFESIFSANVAQENKGGPQFPAQFKRKKLTI